MTGETYFCVGKACRRGPVIPVETEKTRLKVCLKIQSLYGGFAFFTKDAIRDIYRQIKTSSKEGPKISVRGLDGVVVDCDVEIGNMFEAPDLNLQYSVYGFFLVQCYVVLCWITG